MESRDHPGRIGAWRRAAATIGAAAVAAAAPAAAIAPALARQQASPVSYASSCSALNGLAVRRLLVTEVLRFDAGEYVPSADAARRDVSGVLRRLPEFCRLIAAPGPAGAGLATVEVWLPTRTWNGRLVAVGADAASGEPDYFAMAAMLARGDGTVSSHRSAGDGAAVASAREMVLVGGDLALYYFGRGPRNVYWAGCGENARLGLQLAREDPHAVDGLVAAAPFAGAARAPALDLAAFLTRGGKLLVLQAGRAAVEPFTTVIRPLPPDQSVARLFAGAADAGCGASVLVVLMAVMTDWLDTGRAPEFIAIRNPGTPPVVCAYPRVAAYTGRGDVADARNYRCLAAK